MTIMREINNAVIGSRAATTSMRRPNELFPENLRYQISSEWSDIYLYVVWLEANLGENWKIVWDKNFYTREKHIYFTCEEDAVMFKLVFGYENHSF